MLYDVLSVIVLAVIKDVNCEMWHTSKIIRSH